ncbi:MAG: hypothetical protein CM15mP112_09710 [Flavobacteriales bacterium]|nr:MAG: hypothetical protein CM15mP112_09710 [Flavobacteriales bacterium]
MEFIRHLSQIIVSNNAIKNYPNMIFSKDEVQKSQYLKKILGVYYFR